MHGAQPSTTLGVIPVGGRLFAWRSEPAIASFISAFRGCRVTDDDVFAGGDKAANRRLAAAAKRVTASRKPPILIRKRYYDSESVSFRTACLYNS